jgi:Leucine-rich repeat (LRR) protein
LRQMKRLNLQNNNLDGPFDQVIAPWGSLEEFIVSGNEKLGSNGFNHRLQGSALLRNINLRILGLEGVNLEVPGTNAGDPIPESIGSLTNLEVLDLRRCGIDMPFPQYFDSLTSLRSLLLDNNYFRGPIPVSSLANISNLTVLSLRLTDLSGGIPEDIDSLSNLVELDLTDNDLLGRIPSTIGNLPFLETLSLLRVGLDGVLPSTMGSMSSLRSLDVSNNDLSGTIPPQLGSLEDLGTYCWPCRSTGLPCFCRRMLTLGLRLLIILSRTIGFIEK